MSSNRYQARITKCNGYDDPRFYALIVYVENDGYERVLRGYEGRHFKTEKNAMRSIERYMAKHGLNK